VQVHVLRLAGPPAGLALSQSLVRVRCRLVGPPLYLCPPLPRPPASSSSSVVVVVVVDFLLLLLFLVFAVCVAVLFVVGVGGRSVAAAKNGAKLLTA